MTEPYVLPDGIIINGTTEIVPDVPNGALVTTPNVARKCKRCGCFECPCCNDWCDSCLGDEVEANSKLDGDWLVQLDDDGTELHRSHIVCAREMKCEYDTEQHPLMSALFDVHDHVFANVGGHFGVTDDGRVWFHGKTARDVQDEHEQKIRTANKLVRDTILDRAAALSNWENCFKQLNAWGQQEHLEGMIHARTLMEWIIQDAERAGLRTSTREGKKMIARIQEDIEYMEKLRA